MRRPMHPRKWQTALACALTAICWTAITLPHSAQAQTPGPWSVSGRYLDVRHQERATLADVATDVFFARDEETGGRPGRGTPISEQVLLAWKITEGTRHGVRLDDLAVVAVISAERPSQTDTTSLPFRGRPIRTQTTIFVDARASSAQQAALLALAKTLAGETIGEVLAIKPQKIVLNIWIGCAAGYASLEASDPAVDDSAGAHAPSLQVRTRRLNESDQSAGDLREPVPFAGALCCGRSFTLEYEYTGRDLDGNNVRVVHRDRPTSTHGVFSLRTTSASRKSSDSSDNPAVARH